MIQSSHIVIMVQAETRIRRCVVCHHANLFQAILQPLELRQPLHCFQNIDRGLELFHLRLRQRHLVDGKIRIGIAVIVAVSIFDNLDRRIPAVAAFHELDVVIDRAAADACAELLLACIDKILDLATPDAPETFVKNSESEKRIFCYRHNNMEIN